MDRVYSIYCSKASFAYYMQPSDYITDDTVGQLNYAPQSSLSRTTHNSTMYIHFSHNSNSSV